MPVRLPVVGVDPPLRTELPRILAPDLGRAVHLPDRDNPLGALGDELLADAGVAERLAHGYRDRGIQAQRLVHDVVQVGHLLQEVDEICGWVARLGDLLERLGDFVAQRLLHFGVLGEQVGRPGEC